MKLAAPFACLASAVREFVAPSYRPELHYMRGPGPATARRVSRPKHNQSIDRYV